MTDSTLRAATLEIEQHAAEAGWDQPARLYALVPTCEIAEREPVLAAAMGLDEATAAGSLTPVEQDGVRQDVPLEQVLGQIMWPDEVVGCAAVVERLVLPPAADGEVPGGRTAAETYAAQHPDRQDVRIVAAATRAGSTYCALRMRSHDEARSVVEGADLVPGLLQLLLGTLDMGGSAPDTDDRAGM